MIPSVIKNVPELKGLAGSDYRQVLLGEGGQGKVFRIVYDSATSFVVKYIIKDQKSLELKNTTLLEDQLDNPNVEASTY
jgi:hypothetical protein